MMRGSVKIGTRGSQLALWQANWVKNALARLHPQLRVEVVPIKTKGDKILDVPLARVGGKGLFVKEIEEAVLAERVDIAVHSMKDMPAEIPSGLAIGAVPPRESPFDALVSRSGQRLRELPRNSRIGTSSLRRASQLLNARPDLRIVSLRGNLDTRLRKLQTEDMAAIVLAAAGLKRLGLERHVTQTLTVDVMVPAVGQGALCIERRADDARIGALLDELDHGPTRTEVQAERALLGRLEGGCQVPIAGFCRWENAHIVLTGLVADLDGRRTIRADISGPADAARELGVRLAERLLSEGADKLLATLRSAAGNHRES